MTDGAATEVPELMRFQLCFAGLRSGLRAIRGMADERDRLESPSFNVFSLLGIHTREVKTHSALLAQLLESRGSHGQGALFMRHFLKQGVEDQFLPPAFADLPSDGWVARREVDVGTGRLDILLQQPDVGAMIVIENKIYAGDQEKQLDRYWFWMGRVAARWPTRALLYLTLDGHKPKGARSEDEHHFECITYQRHILGLLRSTLPLIRSPLVSTIIRQYAETIESLCEGRSMKSTFDQAAIKFLSEKENFAHALEVARLVEQVRRRVQTGLMGSVQEALRPQLPSGWADKRMDSETDGKFSPELRIGPRGLRESRCAFVIKHEWRFYHGLWSEKKNSEGKETLTDSEKDLGSELLAKPPDHEVGKLGSGSCIAWRYSTPIDAYRESKKDRDTLLKEFIDPDSLLRREYLDAVSRSAAADLRRLQRSIEKVNSADHAGPAS